MQIVDFYSHLNGHEHILVHKPNLWTEIQQAIGAVDAQLCRTKVSEEERKQGRILYSPKDLNSTFQRGFKKLGWQESRTSYWVTSDKQLI